MIKPKLDYNFKEDSHFKSEPVLAEMDDIPQIKEIGYDFWQEEGVYPQQYYISVINQKLSYVIKVKRYIIIAVCLVRYNEETGFVGIDLLCVKKDYQKKGIGKLLLSYCIENCKKLGFKKFYLHVATTNKPAFHLYKKLGFKVCETIKNYYFNDLPPDNDAYLMKLIVENNNEEKKIQEIISDEKNISKIKVENEKNQVNSNLYNKNNKENEDDKKPKNNIKILNKGNTFYQNHIHNDYNINNEIYRNIYENNKNKNTKKYKINIINNNIPKNNYDINNNIYNNILIIILILIIKFMIILKFIIIIIILHIMKDFIGIKVSNNF
jgi:ribosomal protein S18 acetylase RimI-like enzyme